MMRKIIVLQLPLDLEYHTTRLTFMIYKYIKVGESKHSKTIDQMSHLTGM